MDEFFEGLQHSSARGALSWQPPAVLCVAAEDQADGIVATLLAAVLLNRGIAARVAALERLEEELETSLASGLQAVVVSALPPEAVPPARAVAKRIRARAEGVQIIVGLWGLEHDLDRAGRRLESAGVSLLETRVGACVEEIERLRHTPGPARTEEPPKVVHGS